jgi:hypothetical protein
MSSDNNKKNSNALSQRVKVQFSSAQQQAVDARADAVGMTTAGYLRSLALQDLDLARGAEAPSSKKARQHATMLQVAELHALAMQVKRLGTNVNQMAKQANSGMVPITRPEVIYILNQHQLLMSQATAAVEKMLA